MKMMTKKEEEMLKKLTEKKKKINKHEKEFWIEVDARKDEILKHFGVEKSNSYPPQNFQF